MQIQQCHISNAFKLRSSCLPCSNPLKILDWLWPLVEQKVWKWAWLFPVFFFFSSNGWYTDHPFFFLIFFLDFLFLVSFSALMVKIQLTIIYFITAIFYPLVTNTHACTHSQFLAAWRTHSKLLYYINSGLPRNKNRIILQLNCQLWRCSYMHINLYKLNLQLILEPTG